VAGSASPHCSQCHLFYSSTKHKRKGLRWEDSPLSAQEGAQTRRRRRTGERKKKWNQQCQALQDKSARNEDCYGVMII